MSGAEELICAAQLARNCSLTFTDRFRAEELLKLWRAYRASGWDITPDRWAERQVLQVIDHGIVPRWDADQRPVYS